MKNYLNLEKLIRIKVKNFTQHNWNTYKKGKKFLGITIREEGIYGLMNTYYGTVHDYLREHPNETFGNGILYFRPRCQLFFENDHETNLFASSKEEAMKKAEEIKAQSGKWITIEQRRLLAATPNLLPVTFCRLAKAGIQKEKLST